MSVEAWSGFAARLAGFLPRFPERTYLIVAQPPLGGGFVQFALGSPDDPAALYAELRNGDFSSSVVSELQRLGFVIDAGCTDNWVRYVGFPSRSSAYEEVAQGCVVALRDGFGVKSPETLVYWAWRDPERMQPGVTYYEGDLDPGASDVEFPELGLRYECLRD